MRLLKMCVAVLALVCVVFLTFSGRSARGEGGHLPLPTVQGGEWQDDFGWTTATDGTRINLNEGGVKLAIEEMLSWRQTYTEHFSGGSFEHTEAISDSVRLARQDGTGQFYPTGVYTSSVFSAGPAVIWYAGLWTHSGAGADSVTVVYRSGNAALPDATWSAWMEPQSDCSWTPWQLYLDRWECKVQPLYVLTPGRYFQYRANFDSPDPNRGAILYDHQILYGRYWASGEAISMLVAPVDLDAWEEVFYTATVPVSTALQIDILAADWSILIPDVSSGTSLQSIDPRLHPAIRLRARLFTDDAVRTPELDVWGLRWSTGYRLYFPLGLR